jgi:hypothetical protein
MEYEVWERRYWEPTPPPVIGETPRFSHIQDDSGAECAAPPGLSGQALSDCDVRAP